MKVFIVFMGLLLINLSFVCYQSDMASYQRLQKELKAVAEECAAGAALFFDEEAYGQGRMVVKDDAAAAYVDFVTGEAERRLRSSGVSEPGAGRTLFYTLHILDEKKAGLYRSYQGGAWRESPLTALPDSIRKTAGGDQQIGDPSVVVDLVLQTEDLFRLPFLEVRGVSRSAMYELSGNRSMG